MNNILNTYTFMKDISERVQAFSVEVALTEDDQGREYFYIVVYKEGFPYPIEVMFDTSYIEVLSEKEFMDELYIQVQKGVLNFHTNNTIH